MLKCLLLFSGGLDSILATKVLQKDNIEVTGLIFISYFFDSQEAEKSARKIGVKLIKNNFSQAHLTMLKNPHYGYGRGLNPCLDCHSLMLRKAYKIFKKNTFDILATGEVLGQRPFSQSKQAFINIEKLSGLSGKILRPLSGQLLPETIYEKKGMIRRSNLFAIKGKSRKEQIILAKKFKIKNYPSPAGGCILTEKEYAKKLKKLLEFKKIFNQEDFELIKTGRHFWIKSAHIILSKNKEENELIARIKKARVIIKPKYLKGPTAFVEFKNQIINRKLIKRIKKMIWRYSNDTDVKKFDEGNYIEDYSN